MQQKSKINSKVKNRLSMVYVRMVSELRRRKARQNKEATFCVHILSTKNTQDQKQHNSRIEYIRIFRNSCLRQRLSVVRTKRYRLPMSRYVAVFWVCACHLHPCATIMPIGVALMAGKPQRHQGTMEDGSIVFRSLWSIGTIRIMMDSRLACTEPKLHVLLQSLPSQRLLEDAAAVVRTPMLLQCGLISD